MIDSTHSLQMSKKPLSELHVPNRRLRTVVLQLPDFRRGPLRVSDGSQDRRMLTSVPDSVPVRGGVPSSHHPVISAFNHHAQTCHHSCQQLLPGGLQSNSASPGGKSIHTQCWIPIQFHTFERALCPDMDPHLLFPVPIKFMLTFDESLFMMVHCKA